MSLRVGVTLFALSLLVALGCAGLVAWRLWPKGAPVVAKAPTVITAPHSPPASSMHLSTIIDLPGDPVIVQRGAVLAPRETHFALPLRPGANASRAEAAGFYVSDTLVSTTGGYMGKFPGAGQEADALAAQLAFNATAMAAASASQPDLGSDDDGGDETPANAAAQVLTAANSNELAVSFGGAPQIRLATLRTILPAKIADLLVANGYAEESAHAVEAASKALFNVQTLPAGSTALAAGALDSAGGYRVTQLAIYENREYVGTIALGETGAYGEAARPSIPEDLLDGAPSSALGARYTLADGLYSAGLRNGMPEPVVREGLRYLTGKLDLNASLPADETFRALYAREDRERGKNARLIYLGLAGSAGVRDCYVTEGADGQFRCFDPAAKPGAEAPTGPGAGASHVSLGDSGASSVGGILAPIKGAPITSLFGMRFHPILHILRLHAGIDFGAAIGSQVRAAADGKVEIAGPVSGFGNHIRIQHKGFETSYSHLSEIPAEIKPGVDVKEGAIIALSGNTGLSTGPHLHFEYYEGGSAVDPMPHLGAEVQATAPTPASQGLAPTPPTTTGPTSVSEAELVAFPAFKTLVDAALEAAAH